MRNLHTLVYYQEQSSSYIPTRGLATSVLDIYRTGKIVADNNKRNNAGVLFHERYNDIALFESELNSLDELLMFETALRFILLRDDINVLEPSVRSSIIHEGSSLETYTRIPPYAKESADLVFSKIDARNSLLPTEKLSIENGVVQISTNPNSIYTGLKQESIESIILMDKASSDFLHTLPSTFSIPFIHTFQNTTNAHNQIFKDFLQSLDINHLKNTEYSIKLGYNIELPFFTNALFSIARNRDHIPEAILELREIVSPLRSKLYSYELEFQSIKSDKELSMIQKDVKAAIKSLTENIYESSSLLNDSVNLIVNLLKSPHKLAANMFNPAYGLDNDYPVLFGSSNYLIMKKLISKDNISTNIENFLTKEEIKKISA